MDNNWPAAAAAIKQAEVETNYNHDNTNELIAIK